MLFIYAEAIFTAVQSKHFIDTQCVQYSEKWYLNKSITVFDCMCACVCVVHT